MPSVGKKPSVTYEATTSVGASSPRRSIAVWPSTYQYAPRRSYDVAAASASPGVVLVASMIESQIEREAKVFDFLKGDERYKFRMGAESRPLYVIEGTLP